MFYFVITGKNFTNFGGWNIAILGVISIVKPKTNLPI